MNIHELLQHARHLRDECKAHQWDDLRRQIDALIELENLDLLTAGISMIETAVSCRQEAILAKQSDLIDRRFADDN